MPKVLATLAWLACVYVNFQWLSPWLFGHGSSAAFNLGLALWAIDVVLGFWLLLYVLGGFDDERRKPVPKCKGVGGHLLGHNYEPVYKMTRPVGARPERYADLARDSRYIHTACTRCGHIRKEGL